MNLLVLSCKQWLIKCPFFRDELYFLPFSGLFINPFAPGDFAEKRVLKLVEWFSGHCRAIKS